MASRIFFAALLGGVVAGLLLAVMQHFAVVPIILEAETYEVAGHGADVAGHSHDGHSHAEHAGQAWMPEDGAGRTAYTFLVSVITAVGFGLLLSAAYALKGGVRWTQGIVWGAAGFAAINLAPALGLPPELPGAAAAPLLDRQLWWGATAVLTAGGLGAIAFAPRWFKLAGVVLLVLPHVVGAPQPAQHDGLVPEDLERSFIYTSLITNAVFWVVLGALTGALFNHLEARTAGERLASTGS
jgi:cobalt transporter subunit CbtA